MNRVHFSTKITDVFLKIPTYRYFLFVLPLYSFQNVKYQIFFRNNYSRKKIWYHYA